MAYEMGEVNLHWSDILVLVAYFVIVIAFGLWSSMKSSRDTVSGYFLASRNMHWIPIGASLFASNIGAEHFIGLAGGGASSGVANAGFELLAIIILLMLGWVFTPVYMASGIYTMPEYLCKRFGGKRIRIYLSVLALLLSVFTKISVNLFAGATFIQMSLGWNIYAGICLLLAIAAIFTMLGGLTAVVWTDFVQTILMLGGAFVLMILAFIEVGGYDQLVSKYMDAEPNNTLYDADGYSCGRTPDYALRILRSATPGEADTPWSGLLLGATISTIWYWCTDQVIVQRILASKTMVYAKASTIMAGYLKYLPLFLLFFPGMAAKVLYPNEVGCVIPEECKKFCGSSTGCSNNAYPYLVLDLMPNGVRGMMMAVMMAAVMSSLTSIFNSSATIFTIDIWANIRKAPSDYEKLFVGRLFVLVLVGVSIAWIPIINASQDSKLFDYIQSITAFLCPPICAVYLLAIFYDRTNEQGAFWSLILGFIAGVVRLGLEFSFPAPGCGSTEPDDRPQGIKVFIDKIHFLHFGCILFGFCLILAVVISHLTKPIPEKHLYRLTWSTRKCIKVREDLDEEEEEMDDAKQSKRRSSSASQKKIPLWRKGLNLFCGFDTSQEVDPDSLEPMYTKEEEAIKAVEFLEEKKWQTRLVNINAVLVVTLSMFIWGFWY